MRSSRLVTMAERVTDSYLARRVLGTVVDHTVESGVARFRQKLKGMLAILSDENLLVRQKGTYSDSEALLLGLGECHRKAGVEMLRKIDSAGSYSEMVHAVINGFEGCKVSESQQKIEEKIAALEDPLARAFIRAFLLERDHVLDLLNCLKVLGVDNLDGRSLVEHAPAILSEIRFSQSALFRELVDVEPHGLVARGLAAIFQIKHAAGE